MKQNRKRIGRVCSSGYYALVDIKARVIEFCGTEDDICMYRSSDPLHDLVRVQVSSTTAHKLQRLLTQEKPTLRDFPDVARVVPQLAE